MILFRPADDSHLPSANTCISRLYIPLYSRLARCFTSWGGCWLGGFIGWLVGLFFGWLVGLFFGWWLVGQLVGWSVGRLVGWLTGWLIDWLVGWLVDWLVDWLVGWLTGWLVGWLDWILVGDWLLICHWFFFGGGLGQWWHWQVIFMIY